MVGPTSKMVPTKPHYKGAHIQQEARAPTQVVPQDKQTKKKVQCTLGLNSHSACAVDRKTWF